VRNILEHPITHEEIIACLERHRDEALRDPAPGDMDATLLDLAIAAVQYRQLKLWERGDTEGMVAALARRPARS
jgi:hypothetical protein